ETPMHNIYIELNDTNTAKNIIPYIGDVRNIDSLTDAFEMYHPQIIFHAAAYKHVPMMEMHPSEAIKTNVGGSKNVADLSMKYNAERFVMISTDKAVNPTNVMGASKRLAEIYVQSLALSLKKNESKNHTRFMTTRFGNVLGSNGSVVPLFKNQISSGGPITITDKRIVRYFMTIPEACELVLEAGRMGNGGEIFVFDMGKPVKIYDMAKQMIMLSGLKPYIDIDIVETGLRPGEKLYEELLNDKEATEATHNDKITIGKVREYDYNDVASQIDDLIKTAKHNDSKAIVTMMKTLVPEYISKNSVFEKLDKHHDTKKTKPNA
ncbi:MAG: polysaccharide biosynthesis protein, partial [Bacteroidales bacterium]